MLHAEGVTWIEALARLAALLAIVERFACHLLYVHPSSLKLSTIFFTPALCYMQNMTNQALSDVETCTEFMFFTIL